MDYKSYIIKIIKEKDYIYRRNIYGITQNHLNALSGKLPNTYNYDLDIHKNTIYHYLALSGNYELLKKAIIKYPEIEDSTNIICIFINNICNIEPHPSINNLLNKNEDTVWHYLALSGNYESLKKAIIEYPKTTYYRNDYGDTFCYHITLCMNNDRENIFHYLAKSGNYESLKEAIKDYPEIIYNKDNYGKTIWHYLAMSGNYESLKKAIKDYPEIIYIKNDYGNTIWHILSHNCDYEVLKEAIREYPHIIHIKNNCRNTIWDLLINNKNYELLEEAYKEFNFDIDILPDKYKLLFEKSEIKDLYEECKDLINYDDIPENFICPISYRLMIDPVMTVNGNSYDRTPITDWLEIDDRDPMFNTILSDKKLISNTELKKEIIKFLKNLKLRSSRIYNE